MSFNQGVTIPFGGCGRVMIYRANLGSDYMPCLLTEIHHTHDTTIARIRMIDKSGIISQGVVMVPFDRLFPCHPDWLHRLT